MELPEWLWIVIEQQGNDENLFGQYDEERDIFFIPAFYDRENAEACLPLMQKVPDRKYEIQAMLQSGLSGEIQPADSYIQH